MPTQRYGKLRRYSLRAALAMMAILAMGFAWLGESYRAAQVQSKTIRELNAESVFEPKSAFHRFAERLLPTSVRERLGETCFSNATVITISGAEDSDMVTLGRLTSVQSVILWYPDVSEKGIQQLGKLTNLISLTIESGTGGLDRGCVSSVASLSKLHELDIDVEDGGVSLARLAQLQQLGRLDLRLASHSDLQYLRLPPKLKSLSLGVNEICADDLRNVRLPPELESFSLSACKVRGEALERLFMDAISVNCLSMRYCVLDDKGLSAIGRMHALRSLDLHSSTVSDRNVVHFVTLRNLENIDIQFTGITEIGAGELIRTLPRLRYVTGIRDIAMREMVRSYLDSVMSLRRRVSSMSAESR